MGSREGTRELEPEETETQANNDEPSAKERADGATESDTKPVKPSIQTIKVTEYYVKYKNL